jgi:hypothetical protein
LLWWHQNFQPLTLSIFHQSVRIHLG